MVAIHDERPWPTSPAIWTAWHGTRGTKAAPLDGEHTLYGFLTVDPNDNVKPIHPKAMPVILTTPRDTETWMTAPWPEAAARQRPLPDRVFEVVARGERRDPPEGLGGLFG